MRKFLIKTAILSGLLFMGAHLNAQANASMLGNKDFKIMEINEEFRLIKPMSLVWVNPYMRNDGTSVRGHYRTAPDGYCWNNFSGCR